MTSKERFDCTMHHHQPDKVVVDFGSTSVTGIHVLAVQELRRYFGLVDKPVRVIEPYQMLGEIDNDLAEAMGIDVVGAWGPGNMFGFFNHEPFKEFKTPWGQNVLVPSGFNTTRDEKGDVLIFPGGDLSAPPSSRMPAGGYFFDAIIRQEPFKQADPDVHDNLEEFGLISDADLNFWRASALKSRQTGKAVVAAFGGTALGDIALVPAVQLKKPKGIRDIVEWYMSILVRPDYIRAVFDRQTEIALENLSRLYNVVGDQIDVVNICGTDFGTQESTFCSPEQFDEIWLPYYRKMNDWIHTHTKWKTFKHSCGAVESLMRNFIRAGFDIINPVQIGARGMDPVNLKKTSGRDVVFWGGGVDTQKTLPFATPSSVREEVLKLCGIFANGGGFVFNTIHNIQANVPTENIVAMIEAVWEFNGTPA